MVRARDEELPDPAAAPVRVRGRRDLGLRDPGGAAARRHRRGRRRARDPDGRRVGRPPRRRGAGHRSAGGRRPAPGPVLAGVPRLPDVRGRRAARPAGAREREGGRGRRPAPRGGSWRGRRGLGHTALVSIEVVVYILTALAAVVVVLTRLRLGGEGGAGRLEVAAVAGQRPHRRRRARARRPGWSTCSPTRRRPLGGALVGIVALALWWVTTVAGLLILVRWLPSRGKHADQAREDTWSEGPGLSLLAHVGMLAGVLVFTYAYAASLRMTGRRRTSSPRCSPCCWWPALPAGPATAAPARAGLAQAAAAPGDAVVGRRKLGESVRGRPIMAYRLGERDEKTGRAVLDDARRRAAHPADPALAAARAGRSAASTCGWCRRTTRTGSPAAPARTPTASTSTATSPTAGPTSTAATSPARAEVGAGDAGDGPVPRGRRSRTGS